MEPVTDETEEIDIFIKCPRFGGTRNGLACAHYDRYRGCRKTCDSLASLIKKYSNFSATVSYCFASRPTYMPSRSSCKHLPVEEKGEYKCEACGYMARSPRGLRTHLSRSHKDQAWLREQFDSRMREKEQEVSTEHTSSEDSTSTESS